MEGGRGADLARLVKLYRKTDQYLCGEKATQPDQDGSFEKRVKRTEEPFTTALAAALARAAGRVPIDKKD